MANYLRVYFINIGQLTVAPAPPEQWNPATLTCTEPEEATLLEWVKAERDRAEREEDEEHGDNRLEFVRDVLFDDEAWEGKAPGIRFGANIRGAGWAMEDLEQLSASLPEPLRSRFSKEPSYDGNAEFPVDLAEDSPVRALDLSSYKIFYRRDVEALHREYEKVDGGSLEIGVDEFEGWGSLFNEANRRAEYDFALFDYDE